MFKCLAIPKYVKVFDDLKKVVCACFEKIHDQNYKACIESYKKTYMDLGIASHKDICSFRTVLWKKGEGISFFGKQALMSVYFES